MLLSIIFITSGKNFGERLSESGQSIGRLHKTCKKAVPGTIPFSVGRVDTSIATESVLNVHFIIYKKLAGQPIDGYFTRKGKGRPASFRRKKCVVPDDVDLAKVRNYTQKWLPAVDNVGYVAERDKKRGRAACVRSVMAPCELQHALHGK
ncbi:uncharacterized protein TNCV_5122861 [Trichonephila clavipes]|nr:uncharacterized protein TNCV_5122861 [Trichonephila clavipes]